jgi:hypothetical protein
MEFKAKENCEELQKMLKYQDNMFFENKNKA